MTASYLHAPSLLGYLAAGVVLGPAGLDWIIPGPTLNFLSEVGVVLLLFMVGLEFSVSHFWVTRKAVLTAGLLQMGMIGMPVAGGLWMLGYDPRIAALLGGAAAVSSTALVAKQLGDQGELTTRHGRTAIFVLVCQDLATIPMLALLAIWTRGGELTVMHVVAEVAWILLLFTIAAMASKRLLHALLVWVARHGNEEAFVLMSLTVVIGAASGAHAIGVSAALGAFLAGIILGESDFRHHMEDNIRPFSNVLSGLFFITIGLQLDVSQIFAAATGQPLLVALVLSMTVAPLFVLYHDRLARSLVSRAGQGNPPQMEDLNIAAHAESLRNHVVICGAGKLGQIVSRALTVSEIPHLLIESSYDRVLAARAMELPVYYGDAGRFNTLRAACVDHVSLVVITFSNFHLSLRIAQWLYRTHPAIQIVATCADDQDADRLRQIPGVRVYIEHLAAGLTLAEQAMLLMGVGAEAADSRIAAMRNELCLSQYC